MEFIKPLNNEELAELHKQAADEYTRWDCGDDIDRDTDECAGKLVPRLLANIIDLTALLNTRIEMWESEVKDRTGKTRQVNQLKAHIVEMSTAIAHFTHKQGDESELQAAIDGLGDEMYLLDDADECRRLRLEIERLQAEVKDLQRTISCNSDDSDEIRAELTQRAETAEADLAMYRLAERRCPVGHVYLANSPEVCPWCRLQATEQKLHDLAAVAEGTKDKNGMFMAKALPGLALAVIAAAEDTTPASAGSTKLAELAKLADVLSLVAIEQDGYESVFLKLVNAVHKAAEPTLEQKLAALDAAEHSRGPLHKMAAEGTHR